MKKIIKLKESELVGLIQKILREQGVVGSITRVGNISKSTSRGGSRMKGPDTGGGDVDPCHFENIKTAINTCIKSKNTYKSTRNSDYYGRKLYDAMNGITMSQDNTYKAFEEITDRDNFCRTVANFNFEGEGIVEWLMDEQFLNYNKLWNIIKQKVGENFVPDECEFKKSLEDPFYNGNKKIYT